MAGERDKPHNRNREFWRSLLYVPASNPRFIEKAHLRKADAIVLDLEDSVIPEKKSEARNALKQGVPSVAQSGADVLIRINRPLRLAVSDIEKSVEAGATGLMITKTHSAAHIQLLSELVGECELEYGRPLGATCFFVQLETAGAINCAPEICAADPRIVGASVGSEDLAMNAGVEASEDFLLHAKKTVIFAALAANVVPYGLVGTVADYGDLDHVRRLALKSKRIGARGATCIHPSVVPVLNKIFSPTPEEIAHAQRVVAADQDAKSRGLGAFELDGRMIDIPIVERARKLLRQAGEPLI